MKLYITEDGKYVGTKAEAGKMGTPEEVPVDKPGLLRYLNALVEVMSDFNAAAPQPAPAFLVGDGRIEPLHFDDEWERMPIARKAHFAALFCEEARLTLGRENAPAKAAQGYKGKGGPVLPITGAPEGPVEVEYDEEEEVSDD